MDFEEAIMALSKMKKRREDDANERYMSKELKELRLRDVEALGIAIAALTEDLNGDKNNPLTTEELREMIGRPVWLQSKQNKDTGRWVIIAEVYSDSVYTDDGTMIPRWDGSIWEFYRQPPKKEGQEV